MTAWTEGMLAFDSIAAIFFLILFSVFILFSVSPGLFPTYFVYIVLGLILFWFFSQINFSILALFSTHFYVLSIFLLVLTLIIGQVTRGTIRWIPIGSLTFQPAEIVRPLLLVFFAGYLTQKELTIQRLIKAFLLLALPLFLIVVQPSLGVSVLTFFGFLGVLIASNVNKKLIAVIISKTTTKNRMFFFAVSQPNLIASPRGNISFIYSM